MSPPVVQRPRVVVVLPRGEAIRNFVYTGALSSLRREVDLTLLSVIPNERLREILAREGGGVQELKGAASRQPVRFLWELAEMAHGRWLWSAAAQERWRLRDAEARTPAEKAKRTVKKAISLPFATRRGVEVLSGVQGLASRWLRTTDEYVDLLRRLRPSLVFNGSHVHSHLAHPVVEAARWLGIPTAAFIFSWDNLTSQGRILPPYDHYLVWNESLRDQLLALYDGVDPSHVYVTGTPQFDFYGRPEFQDDRETFCSAVGADPARPIVLYSTGMANHMPGEEIIVERIADMLGRMADRPQLLVRVYAKDRTGRFDALKDRRRDVLFPSIPWEPAHLTPLPEDSRLLTNMLRHAALGINVASTVSLELCMFDKPVINVGYNPPGMDAASLPVDYIRYYDYDHYRPVVESGAVELARSESQLEDMLRAALAAPGRLGTERRALVKSFFGETLDGRSATRVARTLADLSRGRGRGDA
jgi:hypothetical protein